MAELRGFNEYKLREMININEACDQKLSRKLFNIAEFYL